MKQAECAETMTVLSKKLSWLLRHGAVKQGLHVQANGYIKVEEILMHPHYKRYFTLEILKSLVEMDQKQRYALRRNAKTGCYEIRANQGHSMLQVQSDKCLKPILTITEVSLAVHGTYWKHWPGIKSEGLKRMSRNHVHFAASDIKADNISGFRSDCQILIYLDVNKVLESDELELYRSDNNVILCPGRLDGSIPTTYFKKVVDRRTGKLIAF